MLAFSSGTSKSGNTGAIIVTSGAATGGQAGAVTVSVGATDTGAGGAQGGDVLEGVAYKAFNLTQANRVGIQSAGVLIGNAETLNFIGVGNTFVVNGTTVDVSIQGGGGSGVASTITVADESSDTTCFPLFATAATGDKRRDTWRKAQKKLHQEIIPDIQMFHMVGFSRVNPRIKFTPTISTNSEIQISQVKFN